jgi:NDP-sugar pyrophosphorylase family protein
VCGVDVAAIIVVGARPEDLEAAAARNGHGPAFPERFAGVPLSLLPVVGKPVVDRMIERMRLAGVQAVTIVTDQGLQKTVVLDTTTSNETRWIESTEIWRTAEEEFSRYADEGAENVLIVRSGPYAEVDFSELLQFHSDSRQHVTQVQAGDEVLDMVVVAGCRRQEGAFLLSTRLRSTRQRSSPYISRGYLNPLKNARDLRRLAQDALLMRCEIKPEGKEVKPGVWVSEHARMRRSVRVLAPAFIGAFAKLRAGAVVTRCAAIENHAEVDCGTVVEDTTLLPYSYLGAGLDVAHAVVGYRQIAHLRRDAQVEIEDPKLVDAVTASAPWRTMQDAASLAAFIPLQMARGLLGIVRRRQAGPLGEAVGSGSTTVKAPEGLHPKLEHVAGERFSAELAIARRYGNE